PVSGTALWNSRCNCGFHCSNGLWVRVCKQGQWSEADKRQRERVVISKDYRIVFCSEALHWMTAGTAEYLPMAQLFANLSLLPQLAFNTPSKLPSHYPFPRLCC
ncbi:hypothetical protein GOODEAATRI_002202, partial [Goodea atripinnis]